MSGDPAEEGDDPWPDEPDQPFAEEAGGPWPDEPDEPFTEKYGEPNLADLTPDPPDGSEVDDELFRAFWGLVVTINLGLFAAALGLMLVGFRGQWQLGGGVFLLGVAALAWAGVKYRQYRSG